MKDYIVEHPNLKEATISFTVAVLLNSKFNPQRCSSLAVFDNPELNLSRFSFPHGGTPLVDIFFTFCCLEV